MPAQRTIACPDCGAPRLTKATGRQRLACSACGRSFLVRDAAPFEAPAPAAADATPPAAQPPAGAPPVPAPAAAPAPPQPAGAGGIAGVQLLPPAALRLEVPVFDGNPSQPGDTPSEGQPPAQVQPPAGDPETAPGPDPAPVAAGPGRRVGYYGRVTGGRRG